MPVNYYYYYYSYYHYHCCGYHYYYYYYYHHYTLYADSEYCGSCLGGHGVQNRLWHWLPGPGGVPATAGLRGPCAGYDLQLGIQWFR